MITHGGVGTGGVPPGLLGATWLDPTWIVEEAREIRHSISVKFEALETVFAKRMCSVASVPLSNWAQNDTVNARGNGSMKVEREARPSMARANPLGKCEVGALFRVPLTLNTVFFPVRSSRESDESSSQKESSMGRVLESNVGVLDDHEETTMPLELEDIFAF